MKKLILLLYILGLTGCSSLDHLHQVRKEQKEMSFESRMKSNRAFGASNARYALRSHKKNVRAKKKIEARKKRVQSIHNRIEK